MAILKQRLLREGSSGTFDTIHLETQSGLVIMPDGSNLDQIVEALQTAIANKAAASHTHSQYLTSHQSLSGYVPTSRTINGKALTGNVTLTASDVSAAAANHSHAGGISLRTIISTKTFSDSTNTISIPAVSGITLCLILWKNSVTNGYRYNSILLPYARPQLFTANTVHYLPPVGCYSINTGKFHPCSKLGVKYSTVLVEILRATEGNATGSLSDQGNPTQVEVYGI